MAKDRRKADVAEKKSIRTARWIVALAVVVIAGLVISGKISIPGSGKETGKSFNLTEKETRPVLDPELFTGQVRAAYAAAQKYPDLLNEVYCYCFCNEPPFNHKTLLSCFTEDHGAGWGVCQKEALRVAQLHEEGKSINEIKKAIDSEFGM